MACFIKKSVFYDNNLNSFVFIVSINYIGSSAPDLHNCCLFCIFKIISMLWG